MSHRLTALCILILAAAALATGLALVTSLAIASPIPTESLDEACSAGRASSCALLAVRYRYGREVPKDDARALAYARKGCDAGSKFACGYVGDMTYRGVATPADTVAGEAMLRSACASGDFWSCGALRRLGMDPDETRESYSAQ